MYQLDIANQQELLPVNESELEKVVHLLLNEEQVAAAEISLVLVDNPTLRELNIQYLNHDYDTDVLSFLLEEEQLEVLDSPRRGAGKRIEGELIISTEMAIERAPEYKWSAENEFILYLIHGILHLLGYDDLTDEERMLMREREQAVLTLCGLELPASTPNE
ncbi:Endoribonuclease YbeY [Polystyrenella longa]|uniref:Endoribonuclease YbeY n=1 Tax=Polystyrenella longa TaxID=2528007 RepID=A0A518CQ38_9PLAN|nr:rRNA maturation RNase YbeY [Polystyrenella longa]QDU81340.1 Endoribonuclease YbeY [Polystyrenella longa]